MLEVFEPGALNYSTFFCPILSTLSAFRNPILAPLPLSRFLDSLLCVLIAPTTGLAFSLLMPHTLAATLLFSSDRAYPFSELSTSSLSSLDPYSDYVGVNISLNNSTSMSFLNVYAPPREPIPFVPPFFPPPEFSSFWGTSMGITLFGTQRVTTNPYGEEVFDWIISSDLLPLNDPDTPTLLHRSSGSRSSPDISFAPSSLALSCSKEVLQDLGSDHLPILLSITLSPVFCPDERAPSFNFQKARWDGFASYIDSHCPPAEEYSSLSLSSAAALFTSLTLNAAKSSILLAASNALLKPGGLLRWKKRLVKDARLSLLLTKVTKIARLTSPLLDAPRQSSPRPRLRNNRRLALLFHLGLTLNLYTLFFALSLAHLPRLLPLLTFPTVLHPGNRL